MQILIIAGTIGRDAEIRHTQGGDAVAGFSVAVDNGKDKNGNKRDTTWYDCSLWGKRGEGLGPYLTKGTRVTIKGRPSARTHDGKVFRMLCVIDEFTRECLTIRVERKLNSRDVLDTLGDLFVVHGPPGYIRSDNVLHSELLAGFGRKASSRSFQIRVLKSITGWASAALEELAAIANTGSMRVRFAGPYRP